MSGYPCSMWGCEKSAFARNLCAAHYQQRRRSEPGFVARSGIQHHGCSQPGCDRKHYGHGLCQLHYTRKRNGLPLDLLPARARSATLQPTPVADRNVLALSVLWGISEAEVVSRLAADAVARLREGSR